MIYFINYALVIIGLAFCTYLALNNRYNTMSMDTVGFLSIWVMIWVALLFAAVPNGFEPVFLTTVARTLALIANIWSFKNIIINRKEE